VRGRFLTGWVRSSRESPRAAVPAWARCRAKTRLCSLTSSFRPLCCSAVFADQAAEDLFVLDSGSDVENVAGLAKGRFLLQALVRPVAVIVLGVLGQDLAEMPLAEDQHVIEALAAQRAHEPLRV
jgi:hypothetical protein